MPKRQIGGSFAPPLNDDQLDHYETLAEACEDRRCSEYMLELIEMLRVFRQTPDSKQPGTPHPVGVGLIVPLEEAEIERIWNHVPYSEECDVIGKAFDALTGEVRDAAHHLLWFAVELSKDREPLTNDKL